MVFDMLVIDTRAEYIHALAEFHPDVILSDHSLPTFNSLEALRILKQTGADIPFILITSTISEEFAVNVMKEGASDYILKDRLQRLPTAINNSFDKHRSTADKQVYLDKIVASEALFTKAELIAEFGTWRIDLANNITNWSAGTFLLLGYKQEEVEPSYDNFLRNIHPDDKKEVEICFRNALSTAHSTEAECRVINKDGTIMYMRTQFEFELNAKGEAAYINGFNQDITRSKLAQLEIQTNIEELNKITIDLVKRNNDLEQFTYIVSHNLRAPVANIIGLSNMLNSPDEGFEEEQEIKSALATSVGILDQTVIDLNHILQITTQINEKNEAVSFQHLVEDIIEGLDGVIQKGNVTITFDFAAANNMVTIKSCMYSIFYNLIINSIKFNRPGVDPVISISTCCTGNELEIRFKDNGKGITEKDLKSVFGLYKRFDTSVEGKGMGLFMVKMQIENLGGKVSVQSELGSGTTFIIEFPGFRCAD
ncbi:MAG: domain S-box protein [Mucilaginibacter sp.]|nr:domain S-box protein [Mucilaginibacter sp.]